MKIAFYTTKPYDRIWFEPLGKEYEMDIHFIDASLTEETIVLAQGFEAICIFVNDRVTAAMVERLHTYGIKGILLRSAGFNHVDIQAAASKGIRVLRVPSYSPEAVAEHAAALLLSVNRYTHRAYTRTRDFNMNINGLMGRDLFKKTAGIIGTGKIGQAMARIMKGFGMRVLAYDPFPDKELDVNYVPLEDLLRKSDAVSLHCPLTEQTKYIIGKNSIEKMKKGVFLINTSRGALVDTGALIDGLLEGKFAGVGLDVYEEEDGLFFEDRSNEIMKDEYLARLTTFPNVLITSHMGFFTKEAMQSIAIETLENAYALKEGNDLLNEVMLNKVD